MRQVKHQVPPLKKTHEVKSWDCNFLVTVNEWHSNSSNSSGVHCHVHKKGCWVKQVLNDSTSQQAFIKMSFSESLFNTKSILDVFAPTTNLVLVNQTVQPTDCHFLPAAVCAQHSALGKLRSCFNKIIQGIILLLLFCSNITFFPSLKKCLYLTRTLQALGEFLRIHLFNCTLTY